MVIKRRPTTHPRLESAAWTSMYTGGLGLGLGLSVQRQGADALGGWIVGLSLTVFATGVALLWWRTRQAPR